MRYSGTDSPILSIWNIIFHNSEVNKNIEDYKFQQSLVNSYEYWLTKIGNANTLTECMAIHKYIWRQGFKNTNLGPDKYGMFRAKDINFMTTNEVYIGGFNGLNILTIRVSSSLFLKTSWKHPC